MSQTIQPTLDTWLRAGVAYVYLNRPDVRNAFNDEMIAQLRDQFQQFAQDDDLRAVVLGGHGKGLLRGR